MRALPPLPECVVDPVHRVPGMKLNYWQQVLTRDVVAPFGTLFLFDNDIGIDAFDLERAVALAPEVPAGAARAWVDGIVAIGRKLQALLASEGVTAIEALGLSEDFLVEVAGVQIQGLLDKLQNKPHHLLVDVH